MSDPMMTLFRRHLIEKMAMAIYYDDPEDGPDFLEWDDLGETIQDKIRHVAEVAFLALFPAESPDA
jgi:hypothetical protein